MKYLLFFCCCVIINITSAQTVLVDNEEHFVAYTITDKHLNVLIEDKRDTEPNIYYFNRPDKPTNGNEFDKCSTQTIKKTGLDKEYAKGFDNTLLEFDLNGNGKLEGKVDMGVHTGYKFRVQNNKAYPHSLNTKFRPTLDREVYRYGAPLLKRSKATSSIDWKSTDRIEQEHLVYTYLIPLEEVILKDKHVVNFRVLVFRTAKKWPGDRPYGTFIYPKQSCEYSDANQFFSIDLLKIENNAFSTDLKKEVASINKKRSDFAQKNRQYSTQLRSKSVRTLSDRPAFYIQLRNSRYIPLDYYPTQIGAPLDYKQRSLYELGNARSKNNTPYFLEEEFLDKQIFQLKADELKAFYLVASGPFEGAGTLQSLHAIKLVQLEKGRQRIVKKDGGGSITNQQVYIAQPRIPSIETTPAEGRAYKTTADFALREGYYVMWAKGYVWLFEIIP